MPQSQEGKEVCDTKTESNQTASQHPQEATTLTSKSPHTTSSRHQSNEKKIHSCDVTSRKSSPLTELFLPTAFLGQLLLPKPNTAKTSTVETNDLCTVCISSMQGWRLTMEDTSCLHLTLPNDETNTMLIGIFDGHGGITIAEYVAKHLHKYIMKQTEYKDNLRKAILKGFVEIDLKMKRERPDDPSGCTAITIFIRNNILYCSNLGDSRAIAYENGKLVPLSFDHKPTSPLEYKRIIEAGCWVEAERVNGSLALSRAFGDFQFKAAHHLRPEQQAVSCAPDIMTKKLDKNWKFIVLACDGIWEVMSNEKVGDFVKRRLSDGMQLDKICESLMSACLATRTDGTCLGCDNMTVSIVLFKWPE